MTQLAGLAGEIEDAIGLEQAVTLLRRRGGTEVSVPVRPKGSALAEIIGEEATEKLVSALGPGRLQLPMAGLRGAEQLRLERRERAMRMLRDGASLAKVALACELSQRTVSKYRAEIDDRQDELPF